MDGRRLALSPDGGTVYVAGAILDGSERALTVLDAATGARRALVGRATGNALAFAPDGARCTSRSATARTA